MGKRTNKYDDGEFIQLYWEYGDPSSYYVRGHVDEAAFRAALAAFHGDDLFYGMVAPLPLRHAYAFWAMDGNPDVDSTLRECEHRRGAFKVTAWDVGTADERAAQTIAALGARVSHRHLRLHSDKPEEATTWPWPFWQQPRTSRSRTDLEPVDAAYRARYSPELITKADLMELADIADAYSLLITHPSRSIRERLHELHIAHDLYQDGHLRDQATVAPAERIAEATSP